MANATADDLPELLTDAELCSLLRIHRSTLYRHLRRGRGALSKIRRLQVGGERRWVRASVLELLNGNEEEK